MPKGIPFAGHRRKKGNAKTLRICKSCGCPFEIYAVRLEYECGEYCSRKCYGESKKAKGETWPCAHCGVLMGTKPPGYNHNKFCSDACATAGREMTCNYCGCMFQSRHPRQLWCKTCVPDVFAKERMRKYNISAPDVNALIEKQGGTCALCDKEPVALDHDHKTGRVRGVLCHKCNQYLHAVEDVEWLERAVQYVSGA